MMSCRHMDSAVGRLTLVADETNLVAVLWPNDISTRIKLGAMLDGIHHPILCEAERQLNEYFKGERTTFDLPLHFRGTAFQQRVWQQLLQIPYGQTRSYNDLARAIGNSSASRAVGFANSKNPLSIVVPCHRVIGASGKLTGFAGGVETKARLLMLEGTVRECRGLGFGNALTLPSPSGRGMRVRTMKEQQGAIRSICPSLSGRGQGCGGMSLLRVSVPSDRQRHETAGRSISPR